MKPFNKPVLGVNPMGGVEMIDGEPDIVVEEEKPKRKRKSRAKVKVPTPEREDTVVDEVTNEATGEAGEAAPKPLFREGTKRDIAYKALIRDQGCTVAEAMELLGWDKSTVVSQFHECKKISGKNLEKTKEDDEVVFRLV